METENRIEGILTHFERTPSKEFLHDLKTVYGTVIKETAETQLDALDRKWGETYPIVIESWRDNWGRLTEYFRYTPTIRKLIYTTNMVEGYHRQVRKVTKNKGAFPSDISLEKLVYLHTGTYVRSGLCHLPTSLRYHSKNEVKYKGLEP